ncbi:hypothetical protein [Streptomyces sp. NPDC054995]
MDLADQLGELRTRAGGPSYRALERLIARQNRQQKMARSTIQEKIVGRSPLTLPQLLSIVEALAEYASVNGVPLPPQEIDRETWRDRLTAASKTVSATGNAVEPRSKSTEAREWDTGALEQAHMIDLVNLIREARWSPVSTWLPKILREMMDAEISIDGFLDNAAKESPFEVLRTLKALEEEFPYLEESGDPWGVEDKVSGDNVATVSQLLRKVAGRHGLNATPAIVVGLRRSGIGHHVDAYLATVGASFRPASIVRIVKHLQSATLANDTDRLLKAIGRHRKADAVPDLVKRLQIEGMRKEADKVLHGVGEANVFRVRNVGSALIASSAPDDVLREVARGVPLGKHDEYASSMSGESYGALPQMILEVRDEPPF